LLHLVDTTSDHITVCGRRSFVRRNTES